MARFLEQECASPPSPLTAALIPLSSPPRPTLAHPPIFLPPSSYDFSPSPIFLPPSSYDFSPSPSPLPSISSARQASLPKAAIVGVTVAGAVVMLVVAATVLSTVAGFSLLPPAWNWLSSLSRKLSFSRFQQKLSQQEYYGEHGAEDREIDVYSLARGDAVNKAGSAAEATMSAPLSEIVSAECESSTGPFVSKLNLSKYAASELKKRAVIIPGGVVTTEKRVHKMIDELGKVSTCSGGGGSDAGKSTAIVAASAGGNRTTSAAHSRALSVVAPPPGAAAAARDPARAASSARHPARTNLGHVSLSCEISAHRLRFFLFCNSGSTYGEDFASPPPSYNHPISRYYNSEPLTSNNHRLVENRPYVQRQYMHPPALAIKEEPAASPIITEYSQEPAAASPIKPLQSNNDLNNTEPPTSLSTSHATHPSPPSQKPNIIHEYGSAV